MSDLRPEIIREILTHVWRAPILRTLADAPRRYVAIRTRLVESTGQTPGDGYLSTELRHLRRLGLIEQRELEGTRRRAWALTESGRIAVAAIDQIERPLLPSIPETSPADVPAANEAAVSSGVRGSPGRPAERQSGGVLDSSMPHPARRYNYWLGGKDNFQADRDAGEAMAAAFPHIRTAVRENRAFLQRAVQWLTEEAGIRQFLDIGAGLPIANNVHEVAQRIAPQSRVVYVDNDPLVVSTARALLTSSEQGATGCVEADVRHPERILGDPTVRETLDLSQPVAVLLVALLHYIPDDDDPYAIVKRLVNALPAGSYLVLSHVTYDPLDDQTIARFDEVNQDSSPPIRPRSEREIAHFFEGVHLVDPGIVSLGDWHAAPGPRPTPVEVASYGGIARIGGRS